MSDEIEDDVTEAEVEDDALESKIKKLEKEATRVLKHSTELLQTLNKETSRQEEAKQENSEVKDNGENIIS
jgi:hypothetical protein